MKTGLPLRVLAAIAAPRDQPKLKVEREWARIEEALAPLVSERRVMLEPLRSATLPALRQRLRRGDVQVLHFIGHGAFDPAHDDGLLVLEDDRGGSSRVTAQRLGSVVLGTPALRLVVLNACEGARHGEADAFSGVAQTLIQQGVPAVVAMQREITDRASIVFSARFYGGLAEGMPIDGAVTEARNAMYGEGLGIEWGVPALYLRAEDGVLFDLGAGAGLAVPPPSLVTEEVRPLAAADESRRKVPSWRLWTSLAAVLFVTSGLVVLIRNVRSGQGESRLAVAMDRSDARSPAGGQAPAPAVPKPPPDVVPALPPADRTIRPVVQSRVRSSPSCPSPRSPEILFVRIEPGTFDMGSDHGGKLERPAHRVTLTRPYCLGVYEITVAQWAAVMGDRKPATVRDGQMPKVDVTWGEAQQFVRRLNEQNPGRTFFLPSEAQWEYAARAGSATLFSFGDDKGELHRFANCHTGKGEPDDGYGGAAPVGVFEPNAWQLYDMQGNVQEWVADRFGEYDGAPAVDPLGPMEGDDHVRRGGSFNTSAAHCRPSCRAGSAHTYRKNDLGFRIAATPLP